MYASLSRFFFGTRIQIRIRPNDTDPTGSGSETLPAISVVDPFREITDLSPDRPNTFLFKNILGTQNFDDFLDLYLFIQVHLTKKN